MLYEITSQNIKTEFYPFQDVFVNSSMEEISVNEILERRLLSVMVDPSEKPFFAISNFPPILQNDYSSSIFPSIEFKSETTLTEYSFRKGKILKDISRMIDKWIIEEKLFEEIDKPKVLNDIAETLNEISPEQINFSEDELYEIIGDILSLKLVSGILNDLTPEQMEAFNEAVKRRPLFK